MLSDSRGATNPFSNDHATKEDPTTTRTREARLNAAFLRLSDTLIADQDLAERLQLLVDECVEIFAVEAAGLMLADHRGHLQLFVSTSVRTTLVEIIQLNAGAGPCLQAFETGTVTSVPDIDATGELWPEFRKGALQQGYQAVRSIPLRARDVVIGTLSLWSTRVGAVPDGDAESAQALAAAAAIGILNERIIRERTSVVEQLQHALDKRVLVEQAKGVLSQTWSLDMDDAYDILRKYARSKSMPVHVLAASIIDRTLDLAVILSAGSSPAAEVPAPLS